MTAPGDDGADDSDWAGGPDDRRTDGRPEPNRPSEEESARRRPDDSSTGQQSADAGGRSATERDSIESPREEWRTGSETPEPTVEYPSQQQTGDSWQLFVRDVLTSVFAVALIGGYLFAISGVWPPMVAIESESMDPHMQVNDLVFVMEEDRFPAKVAHGDTGVVTAQTGERAGYQQYGNSGDVIVFAPDGNENVTPIIHRAMFWVEAGENWCEQADPAYLGGLDPSDNRCTADNAGFITKGDNNGQYDQAAGVQVDQPVKPEWIVGTAEVRLPGLGWFRLQFQ